ncbi:unnamed protein product [Rhizoctonia solani]|uniref:Protein RER1 n=1 Tax=Rhizoctonia solani TaxID=456999 RepID=A0A8H3A863_9AGAM|nr:unnamed protein product [Rhizoctonia solani]
MMNDDGDQAPFTLPPALQPLEAQYLKYQQKYQQLIDRTTPHMLYRWLSTGGLVVLFMLRIVFAQGVSVTLCYALAIYLLNLLLAFLQPKFDPSLAQDLRADEIEEGGEPEASVYENAYDGGGRRAGKDEEFRPFIRRLPEWQFWLSATRATVFAIFATLFEAFDVPVYWPILVIYFFILFGITMNMAILAFRYKSNCIRDFCHTIRGVRRPSVLANSSRLFLHLVRHYYEKADSPYDQVQICTVRYWPQGKVRLKVIG